MPFNLSVFLLGVLGGALAEILKWWQLRESPNRPEYAKSAVYWIITLLMIGVGGVLAWLQGIDPGKPMLALNVGISAPLILKGLAAAVPSTDGKKGLGAPKASPWNFIAGR